MFFVFLCNSPHLWFSWFLETFPFENVFLASPRESKLLHFQHVLLTSFQVRFLSDFVSFLSHLGLHLAPFFRKNPSENRLTKRGPPTWKWGTMGGSRGSQRRRLACALIQFKSMQIKLNSIQFNSNRAEVWLRSGWGLAWTRIFAWVGFDCKKKTK